MSSVSVGAQVECTDGPGGELFALVIDPQKRTITHYVVRTKKDDVERMVPADQVAASTPEVLQLKCTLAELDSMEDFVRDELISERLPDLSSGSGSYYSYYYGYGMADIVPADPQYVHIQSDRLPEGELALKKGTDVRATDGKVGTVDTLVVDDAGTITHFVVDEGHLGRHTELTMPLKAIDYVDHEGVHLKLSKDAIHSLPTMPAGGSGPGHERMQIFAKVFNEPGKAHEALEWLQMAANNPDKPVKIRESAELVRDADGKTRITQSGQPSAGKGAALGAATGGLMALLGPIGLVAGAVVGAGAGAVIGPKWDMGFPDAFLKNLEERLEPGHSALVVLVDHESAQNLTETLAGRKDVMEGQQLVDTLVQELLVETSPPETAGR